jgi:hypothetical protein
MEFLTEIHHHNDPQYHIKRQRQIKELMDLSKHQLRRMINHQLMQEPPRDEHGYSQKFLTDVTYNPAIPNQVRKGILDSTSGTTGNVLIRQDLEAPLYVLFVKEFPWFDRVDKGPSNGLVHAADQIIAPDSNSLGQSVITELGAVTYNSSNYQRATFPIAVFGQGRGVSLKEIAAVRQGGAPYDPVRQELADGIIRLSTDVQYYMFQGNASNSSGTSSSEAGNYNANGFDGLRGPLGSVGTFSGNNAIQLDVSTLNITQSIRTVAARAANNGGRPSAVILSINSKQALDIENDNNKRYNDDTVEIIPGVRVNQIQYANGDLAVIPVPGNTIGTYSRTSDNALVEDIYVLDESTIHLRWLYSENFTTIQIPTGVDGVLSDRWIVFGMFGLEQAGPLYCGKVRRLAS